MLRWRVRLLELSILFFSNKIALVLYWCNVGPHSYYYWFRKLLVHKCFDKTSFGDTNSTSVELFVLRFCFIKLFWITTLPMVNTPPLWIFISKCTAKSASTYQSSMVILLILNFRLSFREAWRYLISLNNLFQLSPVWSFGFSA